MKIRQALAKALEPFKAILDACLTNAMSRALSDLLDYQQAQQYAPELIVLDEDLAEIERVRRARRELGAPVPLESLFKAPDTNAPDRRASASPESSQVQEKPKPDTPEAGGFRPRR